MSPESTHQELVKQVVAARKWMEEAKKHYHDTLALAFAGGVSSTRLARELGLSETAIRMTKKRHML
jgi:hypothetical protein